MGNEWYVDTTFLRKKSISEWWKKPGDPVILSGLQWIDGVQRWELTTHLCTRELFMCMIYIYIYDIYMIYIYINIYICMIYIYIHYESLLCISIEHHDTEKHVQHFLWAPGFCLRTSHVRSTKLHLSAGSGTYIGTLPQQEWLLYLVIW